jgi:integrase
MAYTIMRRTTKGIERWTGYARVPLGGATITRQEALDGTTDETITIKPVYKSVGTFASEAEALKVAEAEEERLSSTHGTSPAFLATATALDYFPLFMKWHRKEPNTLQGYNYLLKRFFLPAFGNDRVRNIEHAALQNFLDLLEDEHDVPPSTLKHLRGALSAFFTVARRRGFRDDNPAEGLTVPYVVKKDQEAWDAALFNVFVRHLPNRPAKTLAKLQVATGARVGEMCALRRSALRVLDDGSGELTISSVVIEVDRYSNDAKSRLVERERTKTKRVRRVPVAKGVVSMLLDYVEHYDIGETDLMFPAHLVSPGAVFYRSKEMTHEEMLADCETKPTPRSRTGVVYEHGEVNAYAVGKCRGALCRRNFTEYSKRKKAEREGRQYVGRQAKRPVDAPANLSPDSWSRIFRKAVLASGIKHVIPAKNLRHTYIVSCLMKGMDGHVVARNAGHTKEVMLNNYVVWSLSSMTAQLDILDDLGFDMAA